MVKSIEFARKDRSGGFIPPIALDYSSGIALYRQIAIWFQHGIVGGQLRPGQRVPSTRALARSLRISRIPVLSAYELLVAEGYLHPSRGRGTHVSDAIRACVCGPGREGPRQAMPMGSSSTPRPTISRRASVLHGPAQSWLEKFRGFSQLDHFPIETWSRLVSRHARRISREIMDRGDPMGSWPLREALAGYLGASRAVKCEPSQILVTAGAQQALHVAAFALLDPQDAAWMEEPGYPGTLQMLKAVGASVVPVRVDEEGLDVGFGVRAAGHARAAFVTPAHQFPLGRSMSAARRLELLGWAADSGAWLLESDYYSGYEFSGSPPPALQGCDRQGRVIYCGSLSKIMFPGLGLGFLVVPPDLVSSFTAVHTAQGGFPSSLLQLAMSDFIREGHLSRHLKRMRSVGTGLRRGLSAALATAGVAVEVPDSEAGTQLPILLPPGVDDVFVAAKLTQHGFSASAFSPCYARPPARGGVLLGWGNLNRESIPAVVNRLAYILKGCPCGVSAREAPGSRAVLTGLHP